MTTLRLPKVLQMVPVCRATWYNLIRRGYAPAPIRLQGARVALWKLEDILRFIETMGGKKDEK